MLLYRYILTKNFSCDDMPIIQGHCVATSSKPLGNLSEYLTEHTHSLIYIYLLFDTVLTLNPFEF